MPNSKDVLLGKWPVDKMTCQNDCLKMTNVQNDLFEKWLVVKITGQNDCLKNAKFKRCIVGKMTSWPVDKMTSQNDSENWQIPKMSSWENDKSTKWPIGKMTSQQNDCWQN